MKNTNNIIRLILSFIVFFFTSYVSIIFLRYVLHFDLTNIKPSGLATLDCAISFIITISLMVIFNGVLKESIEKTRSKYKGTITNFLLAIVVGYLVLNAMQILSSYISSLLFLITGIEEQVANNQATIEELLKSAPLMMIISSCVFAPIEEELLFRGGIRKCIKNKKVFIACSGLIFGLMHVTDSIVFIGELLLLGVVIDYILGDSNKNKEEKVRLSVMSVVLILILFMPFYYFLHGNLINAILNLEASEVIGSVTYVLMGLTLAYLYINNDENIFENIGIHAANNIIAMMLSLFLK